MELTFDSPASTTTHRDVTPQTEAGDISSDSLTSSDDVTPAVVFYANTLRWLDNVGKCLSHVSRPIRRGKIFDNLKPKRRGLMRHLK